MSDLDDTDLALAADRLRSLHVPGDPLVLVNAWDAASAREAVAAGAAAVGTSSAAIAATLGEPDDNTMDLPHVFGAVRRIVSAVPVPVTADLEAGYELEGIELVCALVAAGAVGCNLEDSDHRRPGTLVDAAAMVERVRGVRAAARQCGVDIVVNARIDAVIRLDTDRRDALAEVVRRARLYVEAGADCVYPIGVGDPVTAARLVDELGVPVNVNLGPGVTVAEMADAGVGRVSVGPTYHRRAMADLRRRAAALLGGGVGGQAASTNGGSGHAGTGE